MTPLGNDVVLGDGQVYVTFGLWDGLAKHPSPDALDSKFEAKGFLSWSTHDDSHEDQPENVIGAMLSPPAGVAKTVADVMRVYGYAGATAAVVAESDMSRDALQGVAAGADIGNAGAAISSAIATGAESATQITGVVAAIVRNWPIALVAAVVVVAVAKGWIKV